MKVYVIWNIIRFIRVIRLLYIYMMYIYIYPSTVYFALHMQFTLASFTLKLSRKPKTPHHVAAFLLALDLPKEAQKLHNLAQKAEELIAILWLKYVLEYESQKNPRDPWEWYIYLHLQWLEFLWGISCRYIYLSVPWMPWNIFGSCKWLPIFVVNQPMEMEMIIWGIYL